MKKLAIAFVAAFSLSVFGLTGCGGGGGEPTVVESDGSASEMQADQQAEYEKYMKSQQQRGGN